MDADEARRPRRATHVVAKTIDDVAVLLDLTNETYYSLNDVGSRVWELADGQRTITAIVDTLVSEYDAAPDQIREDVDNLLADLASEGLLTWATS